MFLGRRFYMLFTQSKWVGDRKGSTIQSSCKRAKWSDSDASLSDHLRGLLQRMPQKLSLLETIPAGTEGKASGPKTIFGSLYGSVRRGDAAIPGHAAPVPHAAIKKAGAKGSCFFVILLLRWVQTGCYTGLHRSRLFPAALRGCPAPQCPLPAAPECGRHPGWWTGGGQ